MGRSRSLEILLSYMIIFIKVGTESNKGVSLNTQLQVLYHQDGEMEDRKKNTWYNVTHFLTPKYLVLSNIAQDSLGLSQIILEWSLNLIKKKLLLWLLKRGKWIMFTNKRSVMNMFYPVSYVIIIYRYSYQPTWTLGEIYLSHSFYLTSISIDRYNYNKQWVTYTHHPLFWLIRKLGSILKIPKYI